MRLLGVGRWRSFAGVLLIALGCAVQAETQQDTIQATRKLNERALQLFEQGQYEEATPLAQQAVAISERELGKDHVETASSLDTLAQLYHEMGTYDRAEQLYRRALAIREKTPGPQSLQTADSLYHLGLLYSDTADYARAESMLLRALAIREKLLGPKHPAVADALNNLGTLNAMAGNYAKAEPLYQRALAIRTKALGPEHATTAGSLGNLGLLYTRMGAYAKAEPLYQRAFAIHEKTLGAEHPYTASSANNLAMLYYSTGAYAKAEPLYRRALTVYEKKLGREHPATAGALNNLALVYDQMGEYAKAEPFYQRSLAIREKVLGAEHPDTASSVNNLASLYFTTGAYSKAKPLYQRALAIAEKALGPKHPDIARSLYSLGLAYHVTGAYPKAESLYRQALAMYENTVGGGHPDTVDPVIALAVLHWGRGESAESLALLERVRIIQARNSDGFLLTSSESRKLAYLQEVAKSTDRNVSFSVSVRSAGSVALGLTSVLQYKGRVLDEVSGSVARLRRSVQPADRALFDQVADVAKQLSTLTYQGLGNLSSEQYRQRLEELRQRQEELEPTLARRSAEFRRQVTPVTVAAVQRAIPARAVLVEWFRYQPSDPKAIGPSDPQGAPRYVAYVLKADGVPALVDMGEAQAIENSVRDFLKVMQDPLRRDVKERARELSDKIVNPLRVYLAGADRILVSPDGILNLVPMAALVDEAGQYLVQRFEITYLTSGRDVLRMASAAAPRRGAVIIADPEYGQPSRLLAAAAPLSEQRSADLDRGGFQFRRLAHAASEAQKLKALLELDDSSVLLRLEASEANLERLHGPRILHVASHGFFLRDQQPGGLGRSAEQAVQKGENPLLRAGIALAGANTRRSGPDDDGILTALEAAQLDLQGTELVVLSACESGVGEVQYGEGVYGLRRALFIAGAQTQVTSLWKVADKATSTLMVGYYEGLLKGQGRSAALRQAQQKMLATPSRSHPYYWAGFVPIGDWRPLGGKRIVSTSGR